MKKTALTTAAAVLVGSGLFLAAPPSDAARIFESEDTRVDLHGRLRLGVEGGDGSTEFKNFGSRLGFRGDHTVDESLTVFVNTEFRFDGAIRNSDGFSDVRNTFLGADFTDVGRVRVGNFDSLFFDQIGSLIDVAENDAPVRAIVGGGTRARGNTVAFDSADINGFRFGASAKWQNEDEDEGEEEAINAVAYVGFSQGPFNAALAYDQNDSDFPGGDDSAIGVRADFDVSNEINIGALYEDQGDQSHFGGVITYDYGSGSLFAIVSDLDTGSSSDTNSAAGVSHSVSGPMSVFAELAEVDSETIGTVGARYNF